MAHIPPRPTAIFSPSVARIAASTAKDWNYVDRWLDSKFQGRSVPPFERNPETLEAFLRMVTSNEAADEERELVRRAETAALQELKDACNLPKAYADHSGSAPVRERIFAAFQDQFTREGTTALTSMAVLSCQLSVAHPHVESLGRTMIALHTQVSEIEQTRVRLHILQNYVEREYTEADEMLLSLRSDAYKPANDLARQNLDTQRRVKAMTARIPELKERTPNIKQSLAAPHPTIEQINLEESVYGQLLAQKKGFDVQIDQFFGLADDVKMARAELEILRNELHAVMRQRDAIFEGLIERESPRKDY